LLWVGFWNFLLLDVTPAFPKQCSIMSQPSLNAVCIKLHGYLNLNNHSHYCCACYCMLHTPCNQRFFFPIDTHIISVAPHPYKTICSYCQRPITIIRPLNTCHICVRNIAQIFRETQPPVLSIDNENPPTSQSWRIQTVMLPDTYPDTLSHVIHEEFNGHISSRYNLYYCDLCKSQADHKLYYINYHSISESFSDITVSKCTICGCNVSSVTPIIDCRCFLHYLEGERRRESRGTSN